MNEQLDLIELGTTHGYASVMIKGYAAKRARDRRRRDPVTVGTGKANLDGWARLAAIAARSGNLQRGGERLVAA